MQDLNELLLTDTCILGFAGFREFGLSDPIQRALREKLYTPGFPEFRQEFYFPGIL